MTNKEESTTPEAAELGTDDLDRVNGGYKVAGFKAGACLGSSRTNPKKMESVDDDE